MIKFHKKIKTIIVAVITIGLVLVASWTLFAKNQKFWILSFGSHPTVASDFVDSNVSEKKVGKKSYRVNIKLPTDMNPFKLKRKYNLYKTPEKYKYDFGAYNHEKNVIYIFLKNAKSLLDVCDTFIHEYTHYKQNIKMYDSYFRKYSYNYDNHPYEKAANRKANNYKYECRRYVLKKWKGV
jgi:hypothetical protein